MKCVEKPITHLRVVGIKREPFLKNRSGRGSCISHITLLIGRVKINFENFYVLDFVK